MRLATISTAFAVTVIPTLLRFGLASEMYELEGQKVCKINYEVLCEKYEVPTETGTEEREFSTPVLFDSNQKVIPYALYLLIENYRMTKEPTLLANINNALSSFNFENSLADFTLQVSDIV